MSRSIGVNKYPRTLSKQEVDNEGTFFACPRAISSKERIFDSLEITTLLIILSYSGVVYSGNVETPILSLDLISDLALRSKSKKSKEKINKAIESLTKSGIMEVSFIRDDMFKATVDVSDGYFKYYHRDLEKILKLDTVSTMQRCLHVSSIEFANLYGVRGGHDSWEKFVTYRSHESLGELCGLSRYIVSRTMAVLESENIIASYNVKMSNGGAPSKSIRARYMHRDILRRYVERGLGIVYARIIENKETKK